MGIHTVFTSRLIGGCQVENLIWMLFFSSAALAPVNPPKQIMSAANRPNNQADFLI